MKNAASIRIKYECSATAPLCPVCPNDTEEGRRCNRRVEVVFKMPELPGEKIVKDGKN